MNTDMAAREPSTKGQGNLLPGILLVIGLILLYSAGALFYGAEVSVPRAIAEHSRDIDRDIAEEQREVRRLLKEPGYEREVKAELIKASRGLVENFSRCRTEYQDTLRSLRWKWRLIAAALALAGLVVCTFGVRTLMIRRTSIRIE